MATRVQWSKFVLIEQSEHDDKEIDDNLFRRLESFRRNFRFWSLRSRKLASRRNENWRNGETEKVKRAERKEEEN